MSANVPYKKALEISSYKIFYLKVIAMIRRMWNVENFAIGLKVSR